MRFTPLLNNLNIMNNNKLDKTRDTIRIASKRFLKKQNYVDISMGVSRDGICYCTTTDQSLQILPELGNTHVRNTTVGSIYV